MRPGELFDVLSRTFALALIATAISAFGPIATLAVGIMLLMFSGLLARLLYGRT